MENTEYKPQVGEDKPENSHRTNHDNIEPSEVQEEVVYVDDDYDVDHGEMVEIEQPADVPCYVMDNSVYSQVHLDAVNRDHTTCHYCGEDLTNKRFYNHLFDHHGFTKQQCEMLKQQKKIEAFKNRTSRSRKVTKVHGCAACGLQFITKSGLLSHMSKSPGCSMQDEADEEGRGSVNNIVCPSYGCEKNVPTYLDLAIHVDTDHRDLSTVADCFRIRRVTFPDKASFTRWKRNMEKETCSEFFLRTSQKVNFAVRTFLYKCLFSNSRGQPKGKRCEQCPAFIKCCERNHGQFEVVACFGHLGHEHPTETQLAREIRLEKARQIERFEAQTHMEQQLMTTGKSYVVDEYGRTGEVILLEAAEEVEEVEAFEEEQVTQNGQKMIRQLYLPSPHNPGPSSRHY
ncbi:unnamed protein product [Caenorhabditis sp. 36 PRJEB53466]|nr:unnamed protein product [Caenorhabditis sp. 36 PRJEB53466]